jgi:hypothetical protein
VIAAPRVVYIAGEGRSGSTVLDVLLGAHPEVFGAGELWAFWVGGARAGRCGCGESFADCRFWARVRARFLARVGDADLERSGSLRARLDRARRLPLRWAGLTASSDYARDARAIFETLCEVSGQSVVVDSTKQVGRAQNLLDVDGLEVAVVHLVRDGRGVAWSRMRDITRDRDLRRHGPLRSIVNWRIKNSLAAAIGRRARDRYVRVRYEDLVVDPGAELDRIGRACGLDFAPVIDRLRRGERLEAGHQIGGNLAARSSSIDRLRLDDEWRRRLPAHYERLFRVVGGRLAVELGYR